VYFGQKTPITIEDLFNWTVEAGWDTFWIQGVKNYREELEFYEMLNKLGPDTENDGSGHATSHPGPFPDPLDVDVDDLNR
jgi:hypothetical protein